MFLKYVSHVSGKQFQMLWLGKTFPLKWLPKWSIVGGKTLPPKWLPKRLLQNDRHVTSHTQEITKVAFFKYQVVRHVFDGKHTEQVVHMLVTAGCSETSCAVLAIDSKTTTGTGQPGRDLYVLCTQLAPIVSRSNAIDFWVCQRRVWGSTTATVVKCSGLNRITAPLSCGELFSNKSFHFEINAMKEWDGIAAIRRATCRAQLYERNKFSGENHRSL